METQNHDNESTEQLNADAPPVDAQVDQPQSGDAGAPPVEQYTPNFSYEFTALGGIKEKKEFDDRLKSIIKTKEDEEFIRSLVTKADGLDVNKKNLESERGIRTKLETEYTDLRKDVDFVLSAAERKDIFTIGNTLGLSKDEIRKAVYHDLMVEEKLQGLTPDQKRQYDRSYELENASYLSNRKIQELESKLQSFELQSRKTELETIFNQNDIAPIVQDFDRKNGPNAFWNEVVTRGATFEQMGVSKKPIEVINEIINLYSLKTSMAQPKTTIANTKSLPVIPNTNASSSEVPIRKKTTSLSDLKALASELKD